MKRLIRFFKRPLAEKYLLLAAAFILVLTRLGLWILPFQILRELLESLSIEPRVFKNTAKVSVNEVARAIDTASKCIPLPMSCLTRALAGQVLLRQLHLDERLCIGVAKNDEGRLQAHAWIVSYGRVVIGYSKELSLYTLLPDLPYASTSRSSIRISPHRNSD